jgi:hypothetical protein
MQELKNSIVECLTELKGSGKFAVVETKDFVMPGLVVDGLGEIAFPLLEQQAKDLIQIATKAPFGKGAKTILDEKVRKGREIDAKHFKLQNPQWAKLLNNLTADIKTSLGLEEYTIEAHLYKLLMYQKGDFFLPHKDSEKEDGMFGSLVIGLPSDYTGGELVVSFDGEEVIADFTKNENDYDINYAAFYADCDHEVKPLKSGYRICLVYNLVQKSVDSKIELQSTIQYANQLAEIFEKNPITKPYIVLLGHQYTPANFSADQLKLNDRLKADALLKAAKNLGFYSKLCLVTSYISGGPDYSYGYDYEDDDAPMGEVYEEELTIEHWVKNEIPSLNNIEFEEEDLIASFKLEEDEPLIKESSGYMGNYGPDITHWYHYGAVMIWSTEQNANLLLEQDLVIQLNWIEYFNQLKTISKHEKNSVYTIITNGLNRSEFSNESANFDCIADWLIKQRDKTFLKNIESPTLQLLFEKISVESWKMLIEWLPKSACDAVFEKLHEDPKREVFEKLTAVIKAIAISKNTRDLAVRQCDLLPWLAKDLSAKIAMELKTETLSNLFWIEQEFSPKTNWIDTIYESITQNISRKYLHHSLVSQLLAEKNRKHLHNKLFSFCKEYLEQCKKNKPQPPKNWTQLLPKSIENVKVWEMLKPFMDSPIEQIFDLKRKQSEREVVEYAISGATVDLKTSTIRKSSPHTLRIEKTQASFERKLTMWNEDVALLNQLK